MRFLYCVTYEENKTNNDQTLSKSRTRNTFCDADLLEEILRSNLRSLKNENKRSI